MSFWMTAKFRRYFGQERVLRRQHDPIVKYHPSMGNYGNECGWSDKVVCLVGFKANELLAFQLNVSNVCSTRVFFSI